MSNKFISNLLFSNVEDSEEKENYLKAIDYVYNQSIKGEEIEKEEIDKILGLSELDVVARLEKVARLITVGLNLRDEDLMVEKTIQTKDIDLTKELNESERYHIMFCCKDENRVSMLKNDDIFIKNYLKFDEVCADSTDAIVNKNAMIFMMLRQLIECIYDSSDNDNDTIKNAYKKYIGNDVPSTITVILFTLLSNYANKYHISTIKELKNDALGNIYHFNISIVYPRISVCDYESIVEIINNLCYHYNTNDNITKSNIDKEIKKTIKEIIGYDIKLGEHRLEDIYISYLNEEYSMTDLIINIVIEIIVEDIMENSSESNFGSNKYRKDMINYTTNRYYDYSENSNIILVIYCTIMDFLVNNRNPYTYELFKEALLTLLKEKFIRQ